MDAGEAKAELHQPDEDARAAEIERRDPTERELMEAAYDLGEMRTAAREREIDAALGDRSEFASSESADKPPAAETEPKAEAEAEAEQSTAPVVEAPAGATEQDKQVLARMPAEDRAYLIRRVQEAMTSPTDYTAEDMAVLGRLSPKDREYVMRRVGAVAARPAAPAQHAGPQPLQQAALAQPQAAAQPPADPNSLRGRMEAHWQAQQAAAAARQSPEARAAAYREQHAEKVKEVNAFGAERDASGHPRHAILPMIYREVEQAIHMMRQAGVQPDLATAYRAGLAAAVQTRPEVAARVYADEKGRAQAFRYANPVASDPQLERRMASIGSNDLRTTGRVDLQSVMDRALKLEPEVAAAQAAHVEREKALGFDKPRPSLRQLLETAWSAQAA